MLRASGGLAALMLVAWVFIMMRQTSDLSAQRTTQWMEKRRLAESVASRSVSTLVDPIEFSIDQTNLTSELTKLVNRGDDIVYARVVDATYIVGRWPTDIRGPFAKLLFSGSLGLFHGDEERHARRFTMYYVLVRT